MELLSTRLQWKHARTLISATSLHVSRGWSETLAGVREDAYSDAIWSGAFKSLASIAEQHTYVGNKRVRFFDLRDQHVESRTRILKWASGSAVSNLAGVLRQRPFSILTAPTSEARLEQYKQAAPRLIAADFLGGKLYLQYFSTRAYTHREPLDISMMTASQQRVFAEYDELIGIRTRSVPCFDTVVIDTKSELVEVRVDFQPGMTEDKATPAFQRVVGELNRVAEKFIGHVAVGVGLMNLHPAINPLYVDEKCGRVTALGFVATGKDSSSNNRGQLHRNKNKDFRRDAFHVGGKLHVDRIDPYAIGITWAAQPPKAELELEIKGNARAVYSGKLSDVTEAEIVGCTDDADFDFVTSQLLRHIKRRNK
ncbi:hypothetical protein [uncultured Hydrogenophaga sp.]|uniref:hypothetical protein n=1 Tax=uncultured Hydrogenophaga sp. TaxID=199683 RepID=UPI00265DF49F|nr:hypothetical protein [uncultured Hydrogenophaga sp.]